MMDLPDRETILDKGFSPHIVKQIEEYASQKCGFPAMFEVPNDHERVYKIQIIAPLKKGGLVAITIDDTDESDGFAQFIVGVGIDEDERYFSFDAALLRVMESLRADRQPTAG